MSMMGVLSPVESQACLRVFKDLPAARDEHSIKEKEKLHEKIVFLTFSCALFTAKKQKSLHYQKLCRVLCQYQSKALLWMML